MITGIFGGTFDPMHIGHISILKSAAKSRYLDKIIVIPSAYPPHKSLSDISFSTYRYIMTKIALENSEFDIPVVLSDIELIREGKSYTIDTIREIKSGLSDSDKIVLIYGSDIVFEIEGWYKPEEIMYECELFLAKRPGFTGDKLSEKTASLENKYNAKIKYFNADFIDVSSSMLRCYLTKNEKFDEYYLVPHLKEWIIRNNIYSNSEILDLISEQTVLLLQQYEYQLQKFVTKERLVHSLNTMIEAVKLANIFGGDIRKCAIAGLLHDCAKSVIAREDEMLAIKSQPDYDENSISPDIMHAYLGKQIAQKRFNINDPDILNAIYYHTTSRVNASHLEKIIFIADKIEPARPFSGIEKIREISYKNLNEGLLACLTDIICLLVKTNRKPHPDSIRSYENLKHQFRSNNIENNNNNNNSNNNKL